MTEEEKISYLEGKIRALEYVQRYSMEALSALDEDGSLTSHLAAALKEFAKDMKLEEATFEAAIGDSIRTEYLLGFEKGFQEFSLVLDSLLPTKSAGGGSFPDLNRFPKPSSKPVEE